MLRNEVTKHAFRQHYPDSKGFLTSFGMTSSPE